MKKTKRKILHLVLAFALMFVGGTAMMGFTDANTAFAAEANQVCSHEYDTFVVASTCTDRGYTQYTCTLCGDNYRDNYVDEE